MFIIYTATREIKKRIPATKIVLTALFGHKNVRTMNIQARGRPAVAGQVFPNENPASASCSAAMPVDHVCSMIRGPTV